MKTKNIILILVVITVLIGIYYSLSGGETSEAYIAKIEQQRKEKDNTLQAEGSPFDSLEFHGLNYFPVDAKYRIDAKFTDIDQKKTLSLPTSDGKQKTYLEYGYAEFKLDGIENKLLILEIIDMGPYRGTLFLAFADKTSAKETYGAGRYLEVKKVPGAKSITLDFNEAYNPYCAYTDKYSCPFPPVENVLEVAINAGEKTYH